MRFNNLICASLMCVVWAGCGGDDKPKGGSFGAIADAIENPTGTLAAENATDVADEFEKIAAGSSGGLRSEQSQGEQTIACGAGGDQTVKADSSGKSAKISFNDCCQQADCCLNGGGTWYFPGQSGGGEYQYCADYSVTASCGGGDQKITYEGCMGSGGWTYVIEISGDTFAVSGSYSGGNGTLTIKGANGTFSCTYTSGAGSCTGDGGDFTF